MYFFLIRKNEQKRLSCFILIRVFDNPQKKKRKPKLSNKEGSNERGMDFGNLVYRPSFSFLFKFSLRYELKLGPSNQVESKKDGRLLKDLENQPSSFLSFSI